jgi:hypothetical protein
MRNQRKKFQGVTSLGEAIEASMAYAAEHRRPPKVLADLMGVDVKTLYRWLSESSIPLNKLRQFEEFCGRAYISEYLCIARGDKVVIDIPLGRKARVKDIAEVQRSFADCVSLLAAFYDHGENAEETVAALTDALTHAAFQRSNVMKSMAPELDLFGASA